MNQPEDPERLLSEALRAQAGGDAGLADQPGSGTRGADQVAPARRGTPVLAVLGVAIVLGLLGGAVVGFLSL